MFFSRNKMFEDGRFIFPAEVVGYLNNFLRQLNPEKLSAPARQEVIPVEADQTRHITVTQISGTMPVTIVRLSGAFNAANYLDLIATARETYEAGGRNFIFDLSQVSSIGLSGLVALHSMAILLRGEEPPDMEGGWGTINAMGRDLQTNGLQKHFKLFKPQPEVAQTLEQAGFKGFLEIHTDLQAAITSF
jgi:anti-anti-sigma regulatory factor